jgi:hypothetical protein
VQDFSAPAGVRGAFHLPADRRVALKETLNSAADSTLIAETTFRH